MQKLSAIFFLILVVSASETGIQLLKLPILLNHFREHVSDGRSRSLSDFLQEHYAGKHHADNDSKQDQQLPFKSVNIDALFCLYLPSSPITTVQRSTPFNNKKILYTHHFTLQDHLACIYHPPKAA